MRSRLILCTTLTLMLPAISWAGAYTVTNENPMMDPNAPVQKRASGPAYAVPSGQNMQPQQYPQGGYPPMQNPNRGMPHNGQNMPPMPPQPYPPQGGYPVGNGGAPMQQPYPQGGYAPMPNGQHPPYPGGYPQGQNQNPGMPQGGQQPIQPAYPQDVQPHIIR